MKLPNVEIAIVPPSKIVDYLLNVNHEKGRGKARFFMHMGFTLENWKAFAEALLKHASQYDVQKIEDTDFGTRYVIEGRLATPKGRTPVVRVVWFISPDETIPHLVTAYPLEE